MKLNLPYKFIPRWYQTPIFRALEEGKKTIVSVINRRAGKDKTALNAMIWKMVERVGTYYYFLPTYAHAKKVIWDGIDGEGFRFLDHFPNEIVKKRNEQEMKITLFNGSVFQCVGADTAKDTIIGTNPVGVVFSEYAVMEPEAYDYIRPILKQNGGWAIFVYTPRGKNHGWDILQEAKNGDERYFWQVLNVYATKSLTDKEIEEEKAVMPAALFDQEYGCKFVEGASDVFTGVDDIVHNDLVLPVRGKSYQIGIDLAKHSDFTVLTAIDLHTFQVASQERFNKLDWVQQKERIIKFVRYWNNGVAWMDATGIGDPLYDDLVNSGLKVQPFKFKDTTRNQLIDNLRLMIAQRKVKIPNQPVLVDELKSMQYVPHGHKVKAEVPGSKHDDCIFSLALAVWNLHEPRPLIPEQRIWVPPVVRYA